MSVRRSPEVIISKSPLVTIRESTEEVIHINRLFQEPPLLININSRELGKQRLFLRIPTSMSVKDQLKEHPRGGGARRCRSCDERHFSSQPCKRSEFIQPRRYRNRMHFKRTLILNSSEF